MIYAYIFASAAICSFLNLCITIIVLTFLVEHYKGDIK